MGELEVQSLECTFFKNTTGLIMFKLAWSRDQGTQHE